MQLIKVTHQQRRLEFFKKQLDKATRSMNYHVERKHNPDKALTDWARIYGISRYTLYDRIEKRGWSVEKALETPVGAKMVGDGND